MYTIKNLLTFAFVIFTSSTVISQTKIGHINSQDVMAAMPSYSKAVESLESFQYKQQAELQAMITDYQKFLQDFLENRDDLSPVLREVQEDKLSKKQQNISARQESVQMEIERYSRELNQPIIKNIEKAVETVSKNGNYDYIFDVTMLMVHNGQDLTKEVIKEVLILEGKPSPSKEEVVQP